MKLKLNLKGVRFAPFALGFGLGVQACGDGVGGKLWGLTSLGNRFGVWWHN